MWSHYIIDISIEVYSHCSLLIVASYNKVKEKTKYEWTHKISTRFTSEEKKSSNTNKWGKETQTSVSLAKPALYPLGHDVIIKQRCSDYMVVLDSVTPVAETRPK